MAIVVNLLALRNSRTLARPFSPIVLSLEQLLRTSCTLARPARPAKPCHMLLPNMHRFQFWSGPVHIIYTAVCFCASLTSSGFEGSLNWVFFVLLKPHSSARRAIAVRPPARHAHADLRKINYPPRSADFSCRDVSSSPLRCRIFPRCPLCLPSRTTLQCL